MARRNGIRKIPRKAEGGARNRVNVRPRPVGRRANQIVKAKTAIRRTGIRRVAPVIKPLIVTAVA